MATAIVRRTQEKACISIQFWKSEEATKPVSLVCMIIVTFIMHPCCFDSLRQQFLITLPILHWAKYEKHEAFSALDLCWAEFKCQLEQNRNESKTSWPIPFFSIQVLKLLLQAEHSEMSPSIITVICMMIYPPPHCQDKNSLISDLSMKTWVCTMF